jgi:hypothetical protein
MLCPAYIYQHVDLGMKRPTYFAQQTHISMHFLACRTTFMQSPVCIAEDELISMLCQHTQTSKNCSACLSQQALPKLYSSAYYPMSYHYVYHQKLEKHFGPWEINWFNMFWSKGIWSTDIMLTQQWPFDLISFWSVRVASKCPSVKCCWTNSVKPMNCMSSLKITSCNCIFLLTRLPLVTSWQTVFQQYSGQTSDRTARQSSGSNFQWSNWQKVQFNTALLNWRHSYLYRNQWQ